MPDAERGLRAGTVKPNQEAHLGIRAQSVPMLREGSGQGQ